MKQNSTKGKNDGFKNEDIIKRYINEHLTSVMIT